LINYPVHVSFLEVKIGREGDSLGNVIALSSIYFRLRLFESIVHLTFTGFAQSSS